MRPAMKGNRIDNSDIIEHARELLIEDKLKEKELLDRPFASFDEYQDAWYAVDRDMRWPTLAEAKQLLKAAGVRTFDE